MELSGYLRVLRVHWMAIVAATLLGCIVAFGWTLVQPKVYTADATGFIYTGASDELAVASLGNTYAISRAKSYLDIAKSRAVAVYAIDKLGLKGTPESLVGRIDVTNPLDTPTLKISASGSSPEAARDLAEAWVEGLAQQVSQLENSDTANAAATSVVKLKPVDGAVLPTSPSSPNTTLALEIGLVLGLALGVAYAFIRRTLDRRIRSVENIEREFDIPVVGAVPFDKHFTDEDRLVGQSGSSDYATRKTDDDAVAEAMRELRTNIQFMNVDNPPRIIVVSSSLPGDGKSTMAANLAITIAASGRLVVVVDGDLRRPTVARSFNLLPGVGLTDVLVGRAEISDVLQEWGDTGRLLVMGAGSLPPNPSELLGSNAMASLLNDLAEKAIVLIDAPPLLPVTDAAILAARADGALIVASSGKTTIDALGKALQNLERVQAKCLGIILNRIPRRASGAYYGYQYKGDYASTAGPAALPPEIADLPPFMPKPGRRAQTDRTASPETDATAQGPAPEAATTRAASKVAAK
ncbi:polysaccharide biosynthesis tyrosine autokinase [Agreia sp. PsM10]|uniref:polysaccharide biosynthesis tyrosine autokinase n=1 Tax=Agreia sp. PsM10 TaxID=3030533 RepID=UPI00263BAF81|nr:polysaccharide biosynthesis tyrosine autokinase [Agreia sp. PsM10]MDN4641606.1 polysaccharide biosynthesis tyrosine autokinase [Agreia sp. PsM10]